MVTIKARGEFVDVTEQISLTIQFKDTSGNPIDTDSFPKISIIQPSGHVLMSFTSTGVERISTGKYSYTYTIPYNGPYGVWQDIWQGSINGFQIEQAFQFVVSHTQHPAINSDGYINLGDDPGFEFSQNAIKNINKLIKKMKARLNSSGKILSKDQYGNDIYVDCDIYSIDMLVTFLCMALSYFNSVPYFTFFKFDDDLFVDQFGEIIVEGAVLYALASMALIERGREINIQDNGLSFQPPTISELLNTQYSGALNLYWDQVKYIKNSLRPFAIGLGTFSMNSPSNPVVARLRHLRARRII